MKSQKVLALFLSCVVLCQSAQAQDRTSSRSAEDARVARLPGNLAVSFTGHNVRHADGRQLQRVGIQPTVRVAPTIRGTIEGRDEILEAAVKYLRETLKQ